MITAHTETEVKIRIASVEEAIEHLQANGFVESTGRLFEVNTLYDTKQRDLQKRRTLLRLRDVGDRTVLTWKGPAEPGPHKTRPEIETIVGSSQSFHRILSELGFEPTSRYEKFRTEFRSSGSSNSGVVTVDQTPIGNFLEIEGDPAWIDQTASRLGFSASEYILESYGRLYLDDCEKRGITPGQMIFAEDKDSM